MKTPLDGATFEAVGTLGMSRLGDLLGSEPCVRKALDRASHLPKAPSALLGTVRHQVLDAAMRGRWEGSAVTEWGSLETTEGRKGVAVRLVNEAISLMDSGLGKKEPWRVPLKSAWEPIRWHNELTRLRSLARDLLPTATAKASSGTGKPKIERGLRASEIELKSEQLHLLGSADYVEWAASDVVRISDHKSGAVLDFEGGVKDGYVLQLQGYALAVEDSAQGAKPKAFELELLSDGGTVRVDGSAEALGELRARLSGLQLPWGKSVAAAPQETPGLQCRFCPRRPACASYSALAEAAWKTERVGVGRRPLPLDIWGTVANVEQSHGGMRLVVQSPEGQRRLVAGLTLRHFPKGTPSVGQSIWLYDLQTQEGHKDGKYVHPINFHEIGSRPWLSSWTLRVFVGP